jgi:hypothetical protein
MRHNAPLRIMHPAGIPMTPTRSALALAAAVLFAAVPAQAQNLVANADFDAGTADWTPATSNPAGTTFVADANDGWPSAPSGRLAGTGAGTGQVDADCIAITPAQDVDLFVNLSLHAAGSANALLLAYGDATCGAQIGAPRTTAGTDVPLADGWTQQSLQGIALPAGTQSVLVKLIASSTGGGFDASFDRVHFGPAGTTPVTLQAFGVD